MGASKDANTSGVQTAPPPRKGQQVIKSAGVAAQAMEHKSSERVYQMSHRLPSAAQHNTEVLHQRSKVPWIPIRVAIGGFAVVLTIGYFTLGSRKKAEVTALDAAKVATTGNTITQSRN